jgi:creatinine amidohydrolase
MTNGSPRWGEYEGLRPDELEEIVAASPVAYWPLGLLEHHGWHLPVGFDGVKGRRLCLRMAERTGGVVMPVMWWGCCGGHEAFKWTLYQPPEAAEAILDRTLRGLADFGFRCVVMLCGHYPWDGILASVLPGVERDHPEVRFISGRETDIAAEDVRLQGDHAARWETAYGLALLPELVDMEALRPGRSEKTSWPAAGPPSEADRHPRVEFDSGSPLFAQAGEDARKADGEEAARMLEQMIEHVAGRVREAIGG